MKRKKLRQGYTTGTCAQAAVKAAMQMLLSGENISEIQADIVYNFMTAKVQSVLYASLVQ